MPASRLSLRLLRDAAALLTVGCFLFPLVWWGLTSIKPTDAILELNGVNWVDFTPSLDNYRATLLADGPGLFASRKAIADSLAVATGATVVSLLAALPAAFALANFRFPARRGLFLWVLFQRVLPPIAILVPLVLIYHQAGLRDSHAGVILAHAAANLPFAVLLLTSFMAIGNSLTGWLSGWMVATFDYRPFFALSIAAVLVAIAPVPFLLHTPGSDADGPAAA